MPSPTYKSDRYDVPQYPGDSFTPTANVDYTLEGASPRAYDGMSLLTLGAGTVVFTTLGGTQRTFTALPAYYVIPIRARSVDTGTTAPVEAIL